MTQWNWRAMAATVTVWLCVGSPLRADTSTPDAAVKTFMRASIANDATALKSCTYNADPEFLDLLGSTGELLREYARVGAEKFPGQPKPASVVDFERRTAPIPAEALDRELARFPARVTGDTALAGPPNKPMRLRRIDGAWRVDAAHLSTDPSPERQRVNKLALQLSLEPRSQINQEIAAGKYKTWAEAELAAKGKVSAALSASAEFKAATDALNKPRPATPPAVATDPKPATPRPAPPVGGLRPPPAKPDRAAREAAEAAAELADRTELVGGNGGGPFARPTAGGAPVVGLRYSMGNWGGRPCLRDLEPIADPAAPPADNANAQSVLARDGYVLSAIAAVRDETNVVAIRPQFARLKDGRPDPADQYDGEWIGAAPGGAQPTLLGGGGVKIIGVCGRRGLNLDAVGLLIDSGVRHSNQLGGKGGSPYSHRGPAGAPVVGFRYAPGKWGGRPVLSHFVPVFDRAAANQPGQDEPKDTKFVVARDGYVAATLLVDTDNTNTCAVQIQFVRYRDGVADPKDTYVAPWIGVPSRVKQERLGAPGDVIVGTFGRKGMNVDALGVLTRQATAAAAKAK